MQRQAGGNQAGPIVPVLGSDPQMATKMRRVLMVHREAKQANSW